MKADQLALKKIGLMKAQLAAMSNTLTVLEQELAGSGASVSSARKGNAETQRKINRVLAKRKATKQKKATGGR